MAPRDQVNQDIFLKNFREKFINRLFVEQMKKDFLELKQGKMTMFEYEKEFIRLRKYAKDLVPEEESSCIRFEGVLNVELRELLSALEIRDFATLFAKAQSMETTIHERNKVRGRERNKCIASGAVSNVRFKRPRDVRTYSIAPTGESQVVGFQ